jgi:hypothetical protein
MIAGTKANEHPGLDLTMEKKNAKASPTKTPKKIRKKLLKVEASKSAEGLAVVGSEKVDPTKIEADAKHDEKTIELSAKIDEVTAPEKVESQDSGSDTLPTRETDDGVRKIEDEAAPVIPKKKEKRQQEGELEEKEVGEEVGEVEEVEEEIEESERYPLSYDEIEGLRVDLGKLVKSAKRLGLAFKRLDIDSSGGLSKPEFKRLIKIGAGKNDRFLNDKSRAQLWEAAWTGKPHGHHTELPLEVLQEWIFMTKGAPQKIDD